MGKKKQPTYRVVAADSRAPRDGRFLEVVGTYAPRGRSSADDQTIVTIDHDKALRWLRQGAKPTERVERLLRASGTFDRLAAGAGGEAAAAPVDPGAGGGSPLDASPGGDQEIVATGDGGDASEASAPDTVSA
jgi:small subunit ribosomal protein S16